MAHELFSPSWYRVAEHTPRLRTHIEIQRQRYRDGHSYVLHNRLTGRFHRVSAAAYVVLGLMDGRRTVHEIWEAATSRLGDDAPTQPDLLRLLGELHAADALIGAGSADESDLTRRLDQQRRRRRLMRLTNLFSWRVPLCDPDHLLSRWAPIFTPLFGRIGLALWVAVMLAAAMTAAVHWSDLTHDFLDQLQAPRYFLLLWLLFPVIKLAHELGHAAAAKAFGGEVHEMGMTLLVVTPVPYVDASSAWAFRSKWQRIVVGAAGMMVELVLAGVALAVWLSTQPGLWHTAAYHTMLIAGVSTVLFNANPLLRFDGYYMLMDYLEIPNLRQRATRYLTYLWQRYVCRAKAIDRPVTGPGERGWLLLYAVASGAYRLFVVFAIVFVLGNWFPLLALIFGLFTAIGFIVVPLWKGLTFLLADPRLDGIRPRAIATVAAGAVLLVILLGVLPAPYRSIAQGVVRLPEETFVRADTDGFVAEVRVPSGATVKPGEILIVCRNADLEKELTVLEGRVQELQARHTALEPTDRVKAALLTDELRYAMRDRNRARERVNELTIRSRRAGVFVAPTAADWPGRFVHRGELLGHVLDAHAITVEGVVAQEDIDLVQHEVHHAEVRLSERLGAPLDAQVTRVVPAASKAVPSPALTTQGGGDVPVDVTAKEELKTVERLFQVDLTVPQGSPIVNAGGRAYIRFTFHPQPLARQWARQFRQLFLSRLHV